VENVKKIAHDFSDTSKGTLSIATTHTQARYFLPQIIESFIKEYPNVLLNMHQGTPIQISELVSKGTVDFAIATEALELFSNLIMMPCYRWNRSVIVPDNHPLAVRTRLSLDDIAAYPLVTYVFGFTGRSQLDKTFTAAGLSPHVVFTATDADVIKTYVKLGLGIGIVASMAFDPEIDSGLVSIDASHLFNPSTTKIGFRRGNYLRSYMYDFLARFAPHLSRDRVDQAIQTNIQEEIDELFSDVELPSF